jgi:outer membrane protein OmpA-like peptidoglycan-associated protein
MKALFLSLFCLVLAAAFGCSSKNVFVLLPDEDGRVGSIELSNSRGSLVLDTPGGSAEVSGPNSAPKAAPPMDAETISRTFREALAVEPLQPQSFLLYFRSGSIELTDQSVTIFPEILDAIKQRESRDISVIGHSDRSGDKLYNFNLSTRRADLVRELLVEKGVSEAYIAVSSHGEGNPLVPTADGVSEPKNRRVEVVIR